MTYSVYYHKGGGVYSIWEVGMTLPLAKEIALDYVRCYGVQTIILDEDDNEVDRISPDTRWLETGF